MIEIKQVKTEDQELYGFVEELMHTAFPAQERRDTPQQREYSDSNPLFCNNVIVEDGKPVGMISYWDMGDFYYIEHFAIDPSLRNGGVRQTCIRKYPNQTARSHRSGSRRTDRRDEHTAYQLLQAIEFHTARKAIYAASLPHRRLRPAHVTDDLWRYRYGKRL